MLSIKVSIVICTCNRADDLRQTLAAIAQVCVPERMPTELLVVDNGSTDATAGVVAACQLPNMPVRYVQEKRRGQCHARNAGMAMAQGEIILFTDDDVRPPKNWIAGMCGPILRGDADAVAGGVRLAPHLVRDWMQPKHRAVLAATDRLNPLAPEDMVGANMAFAKYVLEKVPEFDTALGPGALGFADESLFSFQLKEAGYRIASALDVEVEHHFQESRLLRTSFLQTAKKLGQSLGYLSYHWSHSEPELLFLRLMKLKIQLGIANLLNWNIRKVQETQYREGISLKELHLVTNVYFCDYLFHEKRKKPRLYAKRGLIKRREPIQRNMDCV